MSFQCPNCGRPLKVIPLSASAPIGERSWQRHEMRPFGFGGGELPSGVEWTRETPHSTARVESNVIVPFLQALAIGFAVFVLAAISSLVMDWTWKVAVLAGPAAFAVSIFPLILYHLGLLKSKEHVYTEAEAEGRVGEPQRLEVEITERRPGGGRMQFLTIEDIDEDTVKHWARAVSTGDSLGVGRWVGRGAPFTRTQYDRMMSEFTRAGLIVDHGGNIGRQLTRVGRTVLRGLGD